MAEPRVACRTPNADKSGVTNIPAWKFESVRVAILAELGSGDISWSHLIERVRARVSADDLAQMGSLGWHVITVKLELEVRGEIVRANRQGQQMLSLKG